jgi:chemotaxis protein CheX
MNPALSEKSTSHFRPDATWHPLIQAAAHEVFQMMVGTEVQPGDFPPEPQVGEVSAMVGLAGALCAVFRIRCPQDVAANIATKMLGGQGDPSQVCDAMGEICNMVAGNFKGKISGLSDQCMLSVPTVVVGADFNVYSSSQERIEVTLTYDGKPVWLTLEISN